MRRLTSTLAIAAALAAAPAFAQQPGNSWYFGAGIGVGNLNQSGTEITGLNNAQIDDSDTTYTIRGGYRFNPFFALEVGYYDLGKYAFSGSVPVGVSGATVVSGSAKATSWGLSAVGILPMNHFDLYGRIGVEQSKLEANANTSLATGNAQDTQTGATYGVGGRWNVDRNWGVFAEWMKNDKIKVDSYLFGVDFRF
jgi:OOP family OmpA-OmpF porin